MIQSKRKILAWVLSVVVSAAALATAVYALIQTNLSPVTDRFVPGSITCEVVKNSTESFTVTNTGNADAFVRVAVVANWVDKNGNCHWKAPTVTAVTASAPGFTKIDLYYYYNAAVASNGTITLTVTTADAAPSSEYTLQITVLAEAIQSTPSSAATDAWSTTFDTNTSTWSATP